MEDETNVLYDNEHYDVFPVGMEDDPITFQGANYYSGYAVRNKTTSIIEYLTISMPDAMHNAELMNVSLITRPWMWIRSKIDTPERDLLSAVDQSPVEPTNH